MAGVITVAVMAGAIAVAEVITMDGVEATTMDGAIIVAGAVIVGSSSDILKQAASVWRLSQAALAARHAKAAEVRTISFAAALGLPLRRTACTWLRCQLGDPN
jgi:hypothetical protein